MAEAAALNSTLDVAGLLTVGSDDNSIILDPTNGTIKFGGEEGIEIGAGGMTGNLTGDLTGNADTADMAINFSGSLLGDVTGTQGATVVGNNSHDHDTSTLSGIVDGVIAGNGLTGGGTDGDVTLNVVQGEGITVTADSVSAVLGSSISSSEIENGVIINEHISNATKILSGKLGENVMVEGENISLLGNDVGYIKDGNVDWDNSYGFITDGNTGWDNSYGFITNGNTGWDNSYGFITDGNDGWVNSYGFITDGNDGWDNSYGFITSPDDADSDASNEIQTLGVNGNQISLTGSGNITVPYATSAGNALQWDGGATGLTAVTGRNSLQLGTENDVQFRNITARAFYYESDEKLKTNIETIEGALDKVKELRGVGFEWKESGDHTIGLIAQEVEAVLPELVESGDGDVKSVSYGNLVVLLIEAMKEMDEKYSKEIAELKAGNYIKVVDYDNHMIGPMRR